MTIVKHGAALFLVGLLAIAAAVAQAAPPPGDLAPPSPPGGDAPPSPADRPMPPLPRGTAVIVDRGPDRRVHVDIHCAQADTTRACADIATQLFDKASAVTPAQ